MSRLSVNSLPRAQPGYRKAVRDAIETKNKSLVEDATRVRMLRAEAGSGSWLNDPVDCLALADRLEKAVHGVAVPQTLASKTRMRCKRLSVASSLYQLSDRCPLVSTAFTLISHHWTIFGASLSSINPSNILRSVRSDLNRCGVDLRSGALFIALDGAFDRNRALYQLHINGIAFGSAIAAVDKLRKLAKYKRVQDRSSLRLPIYRPIVVQRAPLTKLPSTLPYVLKPYWPSTWLPADGEQPRSRLEQRLPEPYHAQWLLWMDRWRLSDVTLLMGMFVSARGLTLTNTGGTR